MIRSVPKFLDNSASCYPHYQLRLRKPRAHHLAQRILLVSAAIIQHHHGRHPRALGPFQLLLHPRLRWQPQQPQLLQIQTPRYPRQMVLAHHQNTSGGGGLKNMGHLFQSILLEMDLVGPLSDLHRSGHAPSRYASCIHQSGKTAKGGFG